MTMALRTLSALVLAALCVHAVPQKRLQKRAAQNDFDQVAVRSSAFNTIDSGTGVFNVPLQVGCAAALLCVDESFCTMDGTISQDPVVLSSKQILRRVPLSSCRNPDTGAVGKCCRDPNYVDPWPTGNLPANYSGGFDEQGFPTFLNIAKVKQPKKPVRPLPVVTEAAAAVTAPVRFATVEIPSAPSQEQQHVLFTTEVPPPPPPPPSVQEISGSPDELQQTILHIPPSIEFEQTEEIVPFLPQVPLFPDPPIDETALPVVTLTEQLPNEFPTFHATALPPHLVPRPFTKSVDDFAPSNEDPTLIATPPPRYQCGVRNNVPRPTGLNDFETAFGEIPWQAMILSNPHRQILCSGAIVAPNVVLTAASCVYRLHPNEVSVKAGEWKLGYELQYEEPLPFEIINVTSIVPHPYYVEGSASNDTAILMLEHSVSYNMHVNTVCMPEESRIHDTRECIVTGWGKMILQVNVAGAIMHGFNVDVLPRDVCEERISFSEYRMDVDDNVICAKSHYRHNNMCQADRGSPLACRTESGAYELVGIYSQDTGCLPTNQVATFAHVDTTWVKSHYLPPIETKTVISPPVSPSFNIDVRLDADPDPDFTQETQEYRKSNLPPKYNQYLPPV